MEIPPYAKLSNLVHVVSGLNPGKFTLQGTNTYLIGNGPYRILLDTGEGIGEYRTLLETSLKEAGAIGISKVLCTHWHKDHIGGIKQVQDLMFPQSIPIYKKLFLKDQTNFLDIYDGQIFKEQGCTLRAITTPGHTLDHVSFYLEEENALFTGDCVLGHGTAIFEDLGMLIESLNKLLNNNPDRLYCGHGPVVENGKDKLREYIKHRQDREDSILQLLSCGNLSSRELTKLMYPDNVIDAAEKIIKLHLDKLVKQGSIVLLDDRYSR
jgi:ribonuclease/clavin/mitogillin